MKRGLAALALPFAMLGASPNQAQIDASDVVVYVVLTTTFPAFANDPTVPSGAVAMLRGPEPPARTINGLRAAGIPVLVAEGALPVPGKTIRGAAEILKDDALVVAFGLAPTTGAAADGPDSVMFVRGGLSDLGIAASTTLTSDSTRRIGIVTPEDVATTIEAIVGRELVPGDGEVIRIVSGDPPVALYEKYLQYRELSAPIQTGLAVWEVGIGALAIAAVRRPRRSLLRFTIGVVLSLPVLFGALLLVGHLPSLTYATVVTTLAVATAVAGVALARVAERRGIGSALAWSAGLGLGGIVLESLLGWTAALTPMLGGSQLDGFRFFGLPNAFLGLALGGAVLVAARIRSALGGAGLIAAMGLWAGAPWFGADIGGAVTLFAAAGIWWGLRTEQGWPRIVVAPIASVVVGTVLVILANLYLSDAPTHITRFAEGSGGIGGIVEKAFDRLEIGLRLVADQPAALIPVVGTLVALGIVLARPPRALRAGFAQEPNARPAVITILLASVIAYLANDTGVAALGLGFGTAVVAMFAVSIVAAREKIET